VIKALRYFGRVSASVAAGLLETLAPRRKSPAEHFLALDDALDRLNRDRPSKQQNLDFEGQQ
jgi:hypothetical protein